MEILAKPTHVMCVALVGMPTTSRSKRDELALR
jgi:hypothetical protein